MARSALGQFPQSLCDAQRGVAVDVCSRFNQSSANAREGKAMTKWTLWGNHRSDTANVRDVQPRKVQEVRRFLCAQG